MKTFYIQKQKEQLDRTNAFCEFLMQLVGAVFGGGKSKDEVTLDSGEGIEDLTQEQLDNLKATLGEADFNRLYGHLI